MLTSLPHRIATLGALSLLLGSIASAQVHWTRYSDDPVLSMSPTMWESVGQPAGCVTPSGFEMYYAVAGLLHPGDMGPLRGRIHRATSVDGRSWTPDTTNPQLDVGAPGAWDDEWVDTPEILWDGSELELYYFGESEYMVANGSPLGLATSPDGTSWTRRGIVLEPGAPTDFDAGWVESPALHFDAATGRYLMWYTGVKGYSQIGLAVSDDGITWEKDPANPLLTLGAPPGWDDLHVATPSVIRSGDVFEMWYSGVGRFSTARSYARVGYAVSVDGVRWIEYPFNPLVFDGVPERPMHKYWAVDVVFDAENDEYLMWYEDDHQFGAQAIYLATAPRDLLHSASGNTTISDDVTIQAGQSTSLWAAGGMVYRWYPVDGLSDPDEHTTLAAPQRTTTYTALIVDKSCITTEQVTVTVVPRG